MIANDAWGRLSDSDGSSEDNLEELDPSGDEMEACDDGKGTSASGPDPSLEPCAMHIVL